MAKKKARAHKATKSAHKTHHHHAKEDQVSHFFRVHKTARWLLPLLVVLTVIFIYNGGFSY